MTDAKRRTREECLYVTIMQVPPWRRVEDLSGSINRRLRETLNFMMMDMCDCEGCHDLANQERVRLGIQPQD